jgi:hypothetical protein
VFLLSFSILVLAGCNSDQTKNEDNANAEINTALLKEQNDLYEKVCKDFSEINQKVIELNDKIHSAKEKLSVGQNEAIDEIEKKRASVNTRMRGLKKVPSTEWENFRTILEKDIVDMKTQIDEVISGIK